MKAKTIIFMVCILGVNAIGFAQGDSILINTEWQMGKLHKIKPTGPPKLKRVLPFEKIEHPREPGELPDSLVPNYHHTTDDGFMNSSKYAAIDLAVGTDFEGNHLYNGTPADAAIGISNDGRIVSIDNETVAYFKENGDTIVKYGLRSMDWYQDSTMDKGPFDPRVEYDQYQDRFVSVLLYRSQDVTDSRVLVSFSQAFGPDSISWNHYQIHCDSIYTELEEGMYWLDYSSIAINKEELFIGINVFDHDSTAGTNTKAASLLLQIEKAQGYAGAASINVKEWKDVRNADGNSNGSLVPLQDAFLSPDYGPGCYMVSNYSGNSTKFFWYELTGDINDAGAQIVSHLTATSFFYSFPAYSTQMGGNGTDRIEIDDCRIKSGFYQDGKLHFVFDRSDNGWGELVYAKIKVANNSFEANTWGGDEENLNSLFPSIAPFGRDSTEENSIICFLRSGPTIFPQVCAINFDTAWSANPTVVKLGLGLIDQIVEHSAPWDSLERLGDYTDIQRKYNSPGNACWLVGSYASGPAANHFGVVDGIKAWIAEVGDSMIVSAPAGSDVVERFQLYPNPLANGKTRLDIRLGAAPDHGVVHVLDAHGNLILHTKYHASSFSIQMPTLPAGLYFVDLTSKKKNYVPQKLLILP